MTIIYIPVTDEMLAVAQRKADDMGELNNSIEKGQGNHRGFLGELAVNSLLGGEMNNTYNFDLVLGGVKLEVKSKGCKSIPYPVYEASLANYNTRQECDWYLFTRVLYDNSMVYFCGMCRKSEYMANSRFMKEGDIDPSNGYRVKADCWNIAYHDLAIPAEILAKASRRGLKMWIEDEA